MLEILNRCSRRFLKSTISAIEIYLFKQLTPNLSILADFVRSISLHNGKVELSNF